MKFNFIYIFLGACIIIAFLLGKSCVPEPKVIETVTTGKRDTIWIGDTIVKIVPKLKFKRDTILDTLYVPLDSAELAEYFMLRGYSTTYRDTNVEIEVYNEVTGYKVAENVNYRLLRPYIIHDSIFTLNTIEGPVKAPKYVLGLGGDFTPRNLYLQGDLDINRNRFSLAYDPFNKHVKVGYRYLIFRSKK